MVHRAAGANGTVVVVTPQELVRRYVHSLESGDALALVGLLAPQPRFVSPFSVWSTPRAVSAAFTARTRAFERVAIERVLSSGDDAAIRWRGQVGDRVVEGVDVLGLCGDGVSTVDVFLRPADVETVYTAMTSAWPR